MTASRTDAYTYKAGKLPTSTNVWPTNTKQRVRDEMHPKKYLYAYFIISWLEGI